MFSLCTYREDRRPSCFLEEVECVFQRQRQLWAAVRRLVKKLCLDAEQCEELSELSVVYGQRTFFSLPRLFNRSRRSRTLPRSGGPRASTAKL